MARRLFGTDGVRGVAGEKLTAELALGLGRAATERVRETAGGPAATRPRVLIVRDTRESGPMLESALAAGVAAAGGEALVAGVLPTPATPLLIGRYGFDLGAVISASHNPYRDNGIKLFGADGDKLSDGVEEDIERRLDEPPAAEPASGSVRILHGALEDYLRALHERFAGLDLAGRRILLDCANGATHRAAPEIFRRLGAEVTVVADHPDGRNINADCGSTHLDTLAARAGGSLESFDAAFAFDGDGDRVLALDRAGHEVDGDELIALAALHLREQGRLAGDGVAVTVMTNFGFHTAMRAAGVEVAVTQVGDRYVLEELRRRGWTLGGEQSGHVIELGFAPSGDGIASALLALEALGAHGDLAGRQAMEKLPQRLVNVRVEDREAITAATPAIDAAAAAGQQTLEGRGRVLIRPSGTEPLVRVMVEAPSAEEADAVCARLVDAVRGAVGAPAA